MERQTITVDIAPGNNQIQRLKSSQGDIGRPLGVYITQNGIALDCSTYTADLYILKPDGKYFTATVTVDATEHNLITWETAKQETPVAGDCAAQIRIISNGDDVGTARFVEYVEASPGFVGESSESVVESLMEYVRQAATSAETASEAASSASGSASAASGSASAAASSASAAAGSASTAHTDAETASQAAQTAQDVAASIPEDYSTLSNDVTGLKSALNSMQLLDTKRLFDWAIGGWGINGAGEANFSNGSALRKRRCCPHTLKFNKDVTFILYNPSGLYKMNFYTFADYSTSKVPLVVSPWITTKFTIKANTEFSFAVSWADESSSSDTTNLYNELYDALSIVSSGDANDLRVTGVKLCDDLGFQYITPIFNRGYINGSGNLVTSSSYNYSDKIPVKSGDVVKVKSDGNGNGYCVIALYDNNDAVKKTVMWRSGVTNYELEVTFDGYVRTCSANSYEDYSVQIIKATGLVANIFTNIEAIEDRQLKADRGIKNVIDYKYNYDWVVGGWWANGTSNPPNYSATSGTAEQRIASKSYIVFDEDVVFFTDNNGVYRFTDIYTDDDVTYKDEGWASYRRTFKAGRKYWIVLGYITEDKPDITDVYASDLFNNIHIEATGNIVDIRNKVSELYPTVPSYWQTPIDNIVDTVNANALAMATHGDTFVFITDQHWKGNEQISSRLIDYISERVDLSLVVSGGDIIGSKNDTKMGAVNEIVDYYKSFKKPHRIFSTIGNHDVNTVANTDTSTYLTEDELYPIMIKREEKFTCANGTPLVTVFDNESQKIRYIQYCFYGQSVNLDTANLLRGAIIDKGSGWTLVIITHAYWLGSSTVDTNYVNTILSAMDETDAVVACLLVGHVHDDKTATLTSSGGKSLRIISTSTDSWRQMRSAGYVPYTMTPGTITEQCFDIVQIDTSAKTVKLTRVGVGSDRNYSY